MIDEDIIAVPPAQGVRVRRGASGAAQTIVQVCDDGGRGYPWGAIFLPVEHVDGRASLKSSDSNGCWRHRLWTVKKWVKVKASDGTYLLTVDDWPKGADQVLLLLLYFQAIGRGPMDPTPNADQFDLKEDSRYWGEVAQAVETSLLKTYSWEELRGGLIRDSAANSAQPAPQSKEAPPVTFALASCLYPCDILDHMPAGAQDRPGPADASLLRLGELLANPNPGTARPTLFLMAGDQIYADATAGLFDPKSQDDKYRIPYQTMFASRGAQEVFGWRNLEVRMMIDDHEISDNWEPGDEDPKRQAGDPSPKSLGVEAYWRYQRQEEFEPGKPADRHLWDTFQHRGLHFFMGDTRTEREPRTALDFPHRLIMNADQFDHLTQWMLCETRRDRPKFVVTPSMLVPRRLATARDPACALRSDAWDGYPSSLHALLKHICDNEVRHLTFLSGDEHLGCAAEIVITGNGKSVVVRSIHCPALFAPYPFANAVPEDFARHEAFEFADALGTPYVCRVDTEHPPPGDGFVLVTARQGKAGFELDVAFHRGQPPHDPWRRTWASA